MYEGEGKYTDNRPEVKDGGKVDPQDKMTIFLLLSVQLLTLSVGVKGELIRMGNRKRRVAHLKSKAPGT